MYPRRLILNTTTNTRELGGYLNKDGFITNYKAFLRSDSIATCDAEDVKTLLDYGVKTIIDLRSQIECDRELNVFSNNDKVKYFNIPIIAETNVTDMKVMNELKMDDIYVGILENHNAMSYLFNTIIENMDGLTLFHCSAGKDRTGVTSCLLLMLGDIDKYDIIADYEVSYTHLSKAMEKIINLYPDMPMHIIQSKPELIEVTYNYIVSKYNGAFEYLLHIGVKKDDILALRDRLMVKYSGGL